ncbi:hybrid sensor histidine kinase/response regulator transcription factor [Flexithrix dorotheae]|uniref:hybrid sensor histidine kinase/response regulator transcription factor n=1 Tax=Flexithrix dorotheae TaxID=70993 RepID=UPI00036531DB|nr:two-component regulator propeller domain-containing protein [Flexithrix dorotheae]
MNCLLTFSSTIPLRLIWVFFVLLKIADLKAQEIDYRFRHISVNEGLAHTDAKAIIQDEKGFIWIGTNAGLQRYDGRELRLYLNDENEVNAVYNNRIISLSEGYNHVLWISTEGGLKKFDLLTHQYIPLSTNLKVPLNALKSDVFRTFPISENQILVFSANALELLEIRQDIVIKCETIYETEHKENFASYSIGRDESGKIWAATERGLLSVDSNEKSARLFPVTLNDEVQNLTSGFTFHENYLYLASGDRLLRKPVDQINENASSIEFEFFPISWEILLGNDGNESTKLIHQVYSGKDNILWLGTSLGLLKFNIDDPKSKSLLFQSSDYDLSSLSSDQISSIFIDRGNSLWVGTFGGGVNVLNLNEKLFYLLTRNLENKDNTLTDHFVRAILEDEKGNLWIGTKEHGINIYNYDSKKYSYLFHEEGNKNSLVSDRIRCLAKDHKDNIWIGTTDGLCVYNQNSNNFHHLKSDANDLNSISENVIYALDIDKFGQIWAGSWHDGLNIIHYNSHLDYKIQQLSSKTLGSLLSSNEITFIYADKELPEVMVGTKNGLNHILLNEQGQINKIIHYQVDSAKSDQLSSAFIWPIVKEDKNNYWVGTLGGGLNKLQIDRETGNYRAETYKMNEGAPSNDIESLLMDDQGNLWLGGRGLAKFDPKSKEFTKYDVDDGLQGNSFKIGSQFKSKSGMLFFGGTKGLSYFHPDSIIISQQKTTTVFTDFFVNGKRVIPGEFFNSEIEILENDINYTSRIALNHNENNFGFRFAALDYTNAQGNKFRYKLEGFDQNWHEIDAYNPEATYSNLDYGDYTFWVVSSNNDGLWNNKPVSVAISIVPPWWNTPMAKIIYGLAGLLLISGLFLFQRKWYHLKRDFEISMVEERKMEEMHQMRLQFFTNISHEFKTPLTLISGPLQKLMHNQVSEADRIKYYKLIDKNASRLLNLINELMDFRKVETGTLKLKAIEGDLYKFVNDTAVGFEDIINQKQLNFNIETNWEDEKIWFDPGVVEKIIMNLIYNAIRYTEPGGNITVGVYSEQPKSLCDYAHCHTITSDFRADAYVWIKVSDSGIGISPEAISLIFDRYYRITGDKKNHLGSGVGLALVKSLVGLHKGDIHVYSEKEKGTDFFIALPKGKAHLSEEEIQEITKPGNLELSTSSVSEDEPIDLKTEDFEAEPTLKGETPTLLIVEDNEELRFFLKECFQHDYNVIEAEDGLVGYKKALEHFPDLVISDIIMPNRNGVELCKMLKENMDTCHIPVVLLTAKSSEDSQLEGTTSGADQYISKPFNLEILKAKVTNILKSREILRERYVNNSLLEYRELANNQKDREFMDKLVTIIEERLSDTELNIEKICREVGLGRTKLYNKIKAITGESIGQFIKKMRMKKSSEILLSEDVSVTEVMYQVGIQSQSYFTKSFKAEFGITPAQYAKSMMENQKSLDS